MNASHALVDLYHDAGEHAVVFFGGVKTEKGAHDSSAPPRHYHGAHLFSSVLTQKKNEAR